MRKLHLVGLTTDRDGLIFTARKGSKSGGYIVPLDDKVLDAVAEARYGHPDGSDGRPDGRAPEPDPRPGLGRSESSLTPREMQARLRAGRTIEEVAGEAGVNSDWVARFAVPIVAEQAQVIELARGLIYSKPRLGESSQVLNASVLQNLSEKGVFLPDDLVDAGWSAFQLHDTVWMVRFRYRSRGRNQEAQWEIDVPSGRLMARNRHASDLGYVDGGPPHRSLISEDDDPDSSDAPPRPPAAPPRRTRAATARKVTATTPKTSTTSPTRKPAGAPRAGRTAKPAGAAPVRTVKPRAARTATKAAASGAATARARAPKPARTAIAPRPAKAPAPSRATIAGKTAPPTKVATAAKAAPVRAGVTIAGKAGATRAPGRRRPAKATGSEVAPAGGTGGVRQAVAQVSTARVAASMATVDRAPWAAAVRVRPSARPAPAATTGAPPAAAANGSSTSRTAASPPTRAAKVDRAPREPQGERPGRGAGPTFQPRQRPDGVEIEAPKARRLTPATPRGGNAAKAANGTRSDRPSVILPAPRAAAPEAAPVPSEPVKRRRLRSR